jgi:UDP-N-acetylmuramate--alanine ligase
LAQFNFGVVAKPLARHLFYAFCLLPLPKGGSMHHHLMDIGGIGMSGLALILQAHGHRVSGCDKNIFPKILELRQHGMEVAHGHSPDHITPDVDALVLSTGVDIAEPEVLEAQRRGVRVMRRIELLGELMRQKRGIAIAGTHGKTSTSAMVASVFAGCGTDPTAAVGGEVAAIGGNAKVGSGAHFIAEIDESDPLFAGIDSAIAVITNIEDDHVALSKDDVRNNYHASVADLHKAFFQFASRAGHVVYCADWQGLGQVVSLEKAVGYGIEHGEYRAQNLELNDGQPSFTFAHNGQPLVQVRLRVPGKHNVLNAVAALVVAHLEGLDLHTAATALAEFAGAGRRWEVLGEYRNALLVDDYAHNPTKVQAAILGALTYNKKVRVIFQPHRMVRTAREWERYASVLQHAHEVLMLDIYSAGEAPIEGISSQKILERMNQDGYHNAWYFPSLESVKHHVLETAQAGDLIVTMGAGDVTKVLRGIVESAHV